MVNTGSFRQGDANVFFPKEDWRELSLDERTLLFRSSSLENSVTLVDVDPYLRELFSKEIESALFDSTKENRSEILKKYSLQVVQLLDSFSNLYTKKVYSYELCINEPHQISTAYDHSKEAYVGLHIDTHQKLDNLAEAFQLCSINLGSSERYFHFINLDIETIASKLGRSLSETERYQHVTPLKNDFLSAFPNYPIYRVTIQPSQAYIATSQNLIHDGATNREGNPDVVFFLGGYFTYGT